MRGLRLARDISTNQGDLVAEFGMVTRKRKANSEDPPVMTTLMSQ